jgi:hypothetical protein
MNIPCPLYGGTCEINHLVHISWLYVPLNMKSPADDLDVHKAISPLVLHFGVED